MSGGTQRGGASGRPVGRDDTRALGSKAPDRAGDGSRPPQRFLVLLFLLFLHTFIMKMGIIELIMY